MVGVRSWNWGLDCDWHCGSPSDSAVDGKHMNVRQDVFPTLSLLMLLLLLLLLLFPDDEDRELERDLADEDGESKTSPC